MQMMRNLIPAALLLTTSVGAFQLFAVKKLRPLLHSSKLHGSSFHDGANNKHDKVNQASAGIGMERRTFVRAITASAAALTPMASQAAYYADDVGTWKQVPSASDMSREYVRLEKIYSLRFFEYLARLLLNYDPVSASWWEKKTKDLPLSSANALPDFGAMLPVVEDGVVRPRGRRPPQEADGGGGGGGGGDAASDDLSSRALDRYAKQGSRVVEARRAQYSEFVAAVELSVARDYPGEPQKLLAALKAQPGWFQTLAGKRQLAILFTFVQSKQQPAEGIAELLREAENRTVASLRVDNPGSGYLAGQPPLVAVTPPLTPTTGARVDDAAATARSATASAYARLQPSGRVLRIDVVEGGSGYSASNPPAVAIEAAPWSLLRATARAVVDKDTGAVVAVEVVDPGSGYGEDQAEGLKNSKTESYFDAAKKAPPPPPPPIISIAAPPLASPSTTSSSSSASSDSAPTPSSSSPPSGGVARAAKAVAVLDFEVAAVFVANPGFGYSGPGLSANASADTAASVTIAAPPTPAQQPTPPPALFASVGSVGGGSLAARSGKRGGEAASASVLLSPPQRLVEEYQRLSVSSSLTTPFVLAGEVAQRGGGSSSSTASSYRQLTALLPATLPVFLDPASGRFRAALGDNGSARPGGEALGAAAMDPVFGPRARMPVEKDEALTLEAFGKLALSGALCASAAHFVLTPLELTKTRMQLIAQAEPAVSSSGGSVLPAAPKRVAKQTGTRAPKGGGGGVASGGGGGKRAKGPPSSSSSSSLSSSASSLNPVEVLLSIVREEGGVGALFKGADSSAAGYFLAGGVGFSLTELFRRQLVAGAGGREGLQALGLDPSAATIAAALAAGVFATIAVAPFEKARVVLQDTTEPEPAQTKPLENSSSRWGMFGAQSKKQKPAAAAITSKRVGGGAVTSGAKESGGGGGGGVVGALVTLANDERGWVAGFFDGVPLLLAKDIVYAVVKFQCFDVAKTALYAADPSLRDAGLSGSLLVSLGAGAAAGVCAALVSQPGDTVFTKLVSRKSSSSSSSSSDSSRKARGGSRVKIVEEDGGAAAAEYGPVEAFGEVLATQGPAGLYAGAVPRAVFAGSLLALEFLIYDYLRVLFHVTSGDLVVTLDVLGTLIKQ